VKEPGRLRISGSCAPLTVYRELQPPNDRAFSVARSWPGAPPRHVACEEAARCSTSTKRGNGLWMPDMPCARSGSHVVGPGRRGKNRRLRSGLGRRPRTGARADRPHDRPCAGVTVGAPASLAGRGVAMLWISREGSHLRAFWLPLLRAGRGLTLPMREWYKPGSPHLQRGTLFGPDGSGAAR
jgi:hypothetical protein